MPDALVYWLLALLAAVLLLQLVQLLRRNDRHLESALREEQRSELDTACASPAEGLGGNLCNKIKR